MDYRYVNQVTKDFPFPLPLIEDLICKEARNRIWSIFDLETGFHQMHLAEDSRAVTAFVTPWGCYQWTVLPMGMKQAPALFQRLVNWSLRGVPHSRAYVDDILTGTPLLNEGDIKNEIRMTEKGKADQLNCISEEEEKFAQSKTFSFFGSQNVKISESEI